MLTRNGGKRWQTRHTSGIALTELVRVVHVVRGQVPGRYGVADAGHDFDSRGRGRDDREWFGRAADDGGHCRCARCPRCRGPQVAAAASLVVASLLCNRTTVLVSPEGAVLESLAHRAAARRAVCGDKAVVRQFWKDKATSPFERDWPVSVSADAAGGHGRWRLALRS